LDPNGERRNENDLIGGHLHAKLASGNIEVGS
jgi:hypothetical protein